MSVEEANPDLFWLPARLHPEIAPLEFKAFIEEATKPENLLRRTNSALGSRRSTDPACSSSSQLGRKKSMLSNIYNPAIDHPSLPPPSPRTDASVSRGHSMSSRSAIGRGLEGLESLTINDLQRLESLVLKKPLHSLVDPSEGDVENFDLAGNRIRAVIRRSMSMGGAAALSSPNQIGPDQLDLEAIDDSPLISRGPGHIIRRTARTKVRKTSLAGDGNGHRFPPTRRTKPGLLADSGSSSLLTTSNSDHPSPPHSNRSSREDIVSKPASHPSPTRPRSSDDYPFQTDHSNPAQPPPKPPSAPSATVSLPVSKSPSPNSSSTHHQSSEDDQSLNSTSRPDSIVSNSSLLDAYIDQSAVFDDDSPTPKVTSNFEFAHPLTALSPADSGVDTIKQMSHGRHVSSDHLPLATDPYSQSQPPKPTLAPISTLTPPPLTPLSTSPNLPPPALAKVENLKMQMMPLGPLPNRTSKSVEDLPSSATSTPSTPAANSSSSSSTASPQTPPGKGARAPMNQTKTSPTTVTMAAGPSKEGKEKKRAWVKLSLSGSTSEKSKKGKGKVAVNGKQKAEPVVTSAPAPGAGGTPVGTTATTATATAKKESGFLSGLFGSKSKKTEVEQVEKVGTSPAGAVAASKTSPVVPLQQMPSLNPTASGGFVKGRYTSFYRLPIHVERAVYRLSHIKLANPRRPLYEQVLISNLMFWYLGVINKASAAGAGSGVATGSGAAGGSRVVQAGGAGRGAGQGTGQGTGQQGVSGQGQGRGQTWGKKAGTVVGSGVGGWEEESSSSGSSEGSSSSGSGSSSNESDDERPLGNRIVRGAQKVLGQQQQQVALQQQQAASSPQQQQKKNKKGWGGGGEGSWINGNGGSGGGGVTDDSSGSNGNGNGLVDGVCAGGSVAGGSGSGVGVGIGGKKM